MPEANVKTATTKYNFIFFKNFLTLIRQQSEFNSNYMAHENSTCYLYVTIKRSLRGATSWLTRFEIIGQVSQMHAAIVTSQASDSIWKICLFGELIDQILCYVEQCFCKGSAKWQGVSSSGFGKEW